MSLFVFVINKRERKVQFITDYQMIHLRGCACDLSSEEAQFMDENLHKGYCIFPC